MIRILLIVLAAAGLAAAAWFYMSRPTPVEVATAARGTAAEIVYATGVVEPVTWAKVAPLVRARLVELCGCEGDRVSKGDVLARLDDREAQAALAELQARQEYLAREEDRKRELAERNIGTRADLERAESEKAQVAASIAGQRTRLENFVLRAPSDGVVLRQDGEVGEVAEPGSVLFWVGQRKPLEVVAEVNEEDIPRVAPGQRALLSSDAFPGRQLEATVDRITPKGDPVSKTYRVRFDLPDDTPLMIGMTVEVNIVTGEKPDVLLIPAAALAPGDVVYVVDNGVARRRAVTIGIRGTTRVEVSDGLSPGARVIVPAPGDLGDEAAVEIRQ